MTIKKMLGIILIAYGLISLIACGYDIIQSGQIFKMNNFAFAIFGVVFFFLGFSFFRTVRKKKFFDNFKKKKYQLSKKG